MASDPPAELPGLWDDATVEKGVETLAAMGVIPILPPISPHHLRKCLIIVERPSAERLLQDADMHRRILDRYSLRADRTKTMCLLCTSCDITSHRDI